MDWKKMEHTEEGAEVDIKGFLFQASDGAWILSNEPNLKSCCIAAAHKQKSQLFLTGDFSHCSKNVPLHMRGVFHIGQNGTYSLSDSTIVQTGNFPFWTTGTVLICLVAAGFKLKRLLLP